MGFWIGGGSSSSSANPTSSNITDATSWGRSLLTAISTSVQRTLLGLSGSVFNRTTLWLNDGFYVYRIPTIIKTSTGRLLAFCEARRNAALEPSASDDGAIGIAQRYSDDGGVTWTVTTHPFPYAAPWSFGNPTPILAPTGSRIWILFHRHHVVDTRALLGAGTSTDIMRIFKSYSDNDGLTWSTPEEVSSVAEVDHNLQNVGTGVGTVDSSNNRMIIGHWKQLNGQAATARTCGIIYSDDAGVTWTYSEAGSGFECQAVHTGSGAIRLNARQATSSVFSRKIYLSADHGSTWDGGTNDQELPCPSNSASEIRLSNSRLVFSNTVNTESRMDFSLRTSQDKGVTWTAPRVYDAQGGYGYSNLVEIDVNTVGIVYEGGGGLNAPTTFTAIGISSEAVTSPFGLRITISDAATRVARWFENFLGSVSIGLTAGTSTALITRLHTSDTTLDAGGGGLMITLPSAEPFGVKINNVLRWVISGTGGITASGASGVASTSIANVGTLDGRYALSTAKESKCQFAYELNYYNSTPPSFATVSTFGQVVSAADSLNSVPVLMAIAPNRFAGKTCKIQAIIGVSGTSAGNLAVRAALAYRNTALNGTTTSSWTPGGSPDGNLPDANIKVATAPTAANSWLLWESASFAVPADITAGSVWFDFRRTDGSDTNTDIAYLLELRIIEQ